MAGPGLATFAFVQPTYPGDPNGQDDPNPLAHEASQTTEGWFRATGGSFVTTEPVGTEDWMPLNDYPAAKPTYDFYDTVNADKTTIANGDLVR